MEISMTRGSAYVGPSHSESPAWYLDLAFAVLVSLLETSLLWWAYHRCTVALELSHHHGSGLAPKLSSSSRPTDRKPQSVNYHFTRQCNYQCGFCFHTAKTSFVLPIDEAKRGLKMLCEAG
jgi:hypothetical protein